MAAAHADSFVQAGSPAPDMRLVCFPHAGGAPSAFRGWADQLPTGIGLLTACYPGRHNRFIDPHPASLEELADELADALQPYLDTPVALFGHSMGAALAYEVALRLEQRHGVGPLRLFVSGHPAPQLAREAGTDHQDAEALISHVNRLGSATAGLLDIPELREIALATLSADYGLIETYRPPAPAAVGCPVVGYVGDQDHDCPPDDVRAWAQLSSGRFEFRSFPGNHFYLEEHEAELVRQVVGHLQDDLRLRRVLGATPVGGGRAR
ncbi:pyochelin biosynthetic protein PchC [Kitasatospora sp. MAP12-15]|uniref:thioesterase II family protein n=1 Tax=unclassified Kitasatospora TaxID=2633591 RepID=UPI00247478A6|nr:alpha/beta fold hydrolase [Kitasatospora sp. MAP12-44]MDH6113778.1 pyochelin biosynthetic protein PchC [Kitasatospora sp. MAP12-44]